MTYFTTMGRLLQFDPAAFTGLNPKRRQTLCLVNVAVLGCLYGLSASFFSRAYLGMETGAAIHLKIIVAGLPAAFLMHAGTALFAWVFLKAVTGNAHFMTAYFGIGAAAVSLWPMAPVTAALQAGIKTPWVLGLGVCFGIYGLAVTLAVVKKAFGLSRLKLITAAGMTFIYIGSLLYLWM